MDYIGTYDSKKVYQLGKYDDIPQDINYLYVGSKGTIYYGGVRVGLLNPNTYKVLEYDINEWRRAQKKKKKEVPVPACVAETTAVGSDGTLHGADEFFARVAKDIDDLLKSSKEF